MFPVTSHRGNKYIMVMHEVGSNYIDAEPLKSRAENALVDAYETLSFRLGADFNASRIGFVKERLFCYI
jgi:hypothetical protein